MKRTHGESFTVGLDDNSGRVVIIRRNQEIIGNLNREDSVRFAQDIIEWIPQFMRPQPPKCDVAQPAERLPVKEDVPGSSPGVAATIILNG